MKSDIETIGTWVAFFLTLMVYCYLGKDIPFLYVIYRLAACVFVGVALAYGALMAWHAVLVPRLWLRLEGGQWWYVVPLVLCLLLLTGLKRSWSGLGGVTIAFLFGVGAALAVGGGIVGTLLPQVVATFVSLNPNHYQGTAAQEGDYPLTHVLNALLVVVGTISTLMYFYFTAKGGLPGGVSSGLSRSSGRMRTKYDWAKHGIRSAFAPLCSQAVRLATGFGKVFIMFTFGALFATAAISRISLLVDRVLFVIDTVLWYVPRP